MNNFQIIEFQHQNSSTSKIKFNLHSTRVRLFISWNIFEIWIYFRFGFPFWSFLRRFLCFYFNWFQINFQHQTPITLKSNKAECNQSSQKSPSIKKDWLIKWANFKLLTINTKTVELWKQKSWRSPNVTNSHHRHQILPESDCSSLGTYSKSGSTLGLGFLLEVFSDFLSAFGLFSFFEAVSIFSSSSSISSSSDSGDDCNKIQVIIRVCQGWDRIHCVKVSEKDMTYFYVHAHVRH